LRRCREPNPQRKYTSLSARSKHRHSLNPSFWIRNTKEYQAQGGSYHEVSEKFTNPNKFYRGAQWQSEKRTGSIGQRIHRGLLEAKRRHTSSRNEVIPKRTQRPLRVH